MNLNDIDLYLPKYLSAESHKNLIEAITQFPDNICQRTYTLLTNLDDSILQGDGILQVPIVNIPQENIIKADSLILSNSCDNDLNNVRKFETRLLYSPIINLKKFINKAEEVLGLTKDQVESFLVQVRTQQFTQIFYLPKIENKMEESIVFFDKINNCPIDIFEDKDLRDIRKFSLSNFGFYLLLIKLSIHFTRIREEIDRG